MTTVTKTKGATPQIKQQVIVLETKPANIETVDVAQWRNAVNAARQGRPSQLYKLYENIAADGVFSRSIDKRIEAITNAELSFIDANGDVVKELNDLIDTPEFEHLLSEIMEAKAWGVSVIDILSVLPFDAFSVPRRNINLAKKMILPNECAEIGMPYEGVPYIFEVRNSRDPLGYMYKAAPYVIYKRGGFGDWAEFVEVFGMPFKLASYSAYDTDTRDELLRSLKMMGSAPYMVKPKEADIQLLETKSNSNGDLYDRFLDRCDKEILITVLGQTMTTVDGSSKSQSETHKEVEEDINKSDRRFVRRILNRNVLPILEAAGLPVKGGKFIFPEQGESLSTEQRLSIALDVKENGLPVSDDYIYEISGVRKPKPNEVVTRKISTQDPAITDPATPKPGSKKEQAQATLLGKAFSFFAEALSRERAPLDF